MVEPPPWLPVSTRLAVSVVSPMSYGCWVPPMAAVSSGQGSGSAEFLFCGSAESAEEESRQGSSLVLAGPGLGTFVSLVA